MNVSKKAPAASPKVTRRNACDAGIPIQCMQNVPIGPSAVAAAAALGFFMPANGLLARPCMAAGRFCRVLLVFFCETSEHIKNAETSYL
jgi:hypothetical protein